MYRTISTVRFICKTKHRGGKREYRVNVVWTSEMNGHHGNLVSHSLSRLGKKGKICLLFPNGWLFLGQFQLVWDFWNLATRCKYISVRRADDRKNLLHQTHLNKVTSKKASCRLSSCRINFIPASSSVLCLFLPPFLFFSFPISCFLSVVLFFTLSSALSFSFAHILLFPSSLYLVSNSHSFSPVVYRLTSYLSGSLILFLVTFVLSFFFFFTSNILFFLKFSLIALLFCFSLPSYILHLSFFLISPPCRIQVKRSFIRLHFIPLLPSLQ